MTNELLNAYLRPCFVCRREGPCPHREPAVELAYLHAAPMPARRLPAPVQIPLRKAATK